MSNEDIDKMACPTSSVPGKAFAMTRIDTRANENGWLYSVWHCAHCDDTHEFVEEAETAAGG